MGEQKAGVASGIGCNIWVWLVGVVVKRYIDFLILLIPTPLVFALFCLFKKMFFVLNNYNYIDRVTIDFIRVFASLAIKMY